MSLTTAQTAEQEWMVLTMHDDLISRIRYHIKKAEFYGLKEYEATKLLVEAADAIEELSKTLDEEVEINTAISCNLPVWTPITTRPMTKEERKEMSEKTGYDLNDDEAVIITSQLPEDEQVVLTLNRHKVISIDTFENDPDYGCGFYENGDMDGIVAWMPLPELPKDGEE